MSALDIANSCCIAVAAESVVGSSEPAVTPCVNSRGLYSLMTCQREFQSVVRLRGPQSHARNQQEAALQINTPLTFERRLEARRGCRAGASASARTRRAHAGLLARVGLELSPL
jgi:hypothetical protein